MKLNKEPVIIDGDDDIRTTFRYACLVFSLSDWFGIPLFIKLYYNPRNHRRLPNTTRWQTPKKPPVVPWRPISSPPRLGLSKLAKTSLVLRGNLYCDICTLWVLTLPPSESTFLDAIVADVFFCFSHQREEEEDIIGRVKNLAWPHTAPDPVYEEYILRGRGEVAI